MSRAREFFLARGFDAASMSDIARAAGVSKGTLYVYFDNKESFSRRSFTSECLVHAEGVFDLDAGHTGRRKHPHPPRSAYIEFLCRPEKASALRTVVAIADRMPELGRIFYETSPAVGVTELADYFRARRKPACSRSRIAGSSRPSSWIRASPRCSRPCCSISAPRPRRTPSTMWLASPCRTFMRRLLRGRAGVIVLHSEACRSIKTNLFIETDSRLNRSRRAAVSAR